jgi:Helix-turn-helix of DDE superfamily endonuclease
MLKYEDLKHRPKELLAASGLKQDEFEALAAVFREEYVRVYQAGQTVEGQTRQRRVGAGSKGKLSCWEDKLLFILVYEKTYPLQTMLGLQFGLSQGRVNQWVQRLMPVLQRALAAMGMRPERDGSAVAGSELAQAGGAHLVIDGTERRRQRPQDVEAQRELYSGKKKRTPTKTSSW